MADLTIVAAAQRIRVSTTSLKKACRKLGVERWPYRKDRPAAAAGAGAAPAPRDFDEAYVRKLHRKYGGAGSRRSGRPAGGVGAGGIARLESAASLSSVTSEGTEPEDTARAECGGGPPEFEVPWAAAALQRQQS